MVQLSRDAGWAAIPAGVFLMGSEEFYEEDSRSVR